MFICNKVTKKIPAFQNLIKGFHSNPVLCSATITINDESRDMSQCVEEFNRDGVTILPFKVDIDFVEKSKKLVTSALEDGLQRVKEIKGHDLKVNYLFLIIYKICFVKDY